MDRPWWWPTEANEEWAKEVRAGGGGRDDVSLEQLKKDFNQDRDWVVVWDHTGNAYEEYAKMAEMLERMESALRIIRNNIRYLVEEGTLPEEVVLAHPSIVGIDQLLEEIGVTLPPIKKGEDIEN